MNTVVAEAIAAPALTGAKPDADRHFRTDHLHAHLTRRSVGGRAVTLRGQTCKFVVQVGPTAALARLITPQDHALIAKAIVFTGLLGPFKRLSLSMATVKRAEVSHLFRINVPVSIAVAGIGMALALRSALHHRDLRLAGDHL